MLLQSMPLHLFNDREQLEAEHRQEWEQQHAHLFQEAHTACPVRTGDGVFGFAGAVCECE
jgi:hypothetical protein